MRSLTLSSTAFPDIGYATLACSNADAIERERQLPLRALPRCSLQRRCAVIFSAMIAARLALRQPRRLYGGFGAGQRVTASVSVARLFGDTGSNIVLGNEANAVFTSEVIVVVRASVHAAR